MTINEKAGRKNPENQCVFLMNGVHVAYRKKKGKE